MIRTNPLLKYLQQLNLLHAVQPSFCIHHLENLDFFQGHENIVDFADCFVHHAELAFANLSVDLEVFQLPIGRV